MWHLSAVFWSSKCRRVVAADKLTVINPFRTAVPFPGQTAQFPSINSLSPKRDCGSKGSPFFWCAVVRLSRLQFSSLVLLIPFFHALSSSSPGLFVGLLSDLELMGQDHTLWTAAAVGSKATDTAVCCYTLPAAAPTSSCLGGNSKPIAVVGHGSRLRPRRLCPITRRTSHR